MDKLYDYMPKMTIKEAIEMQDAGEVTAARLTAVCLKRIANMDKTGLCLNAVIEVNTYATEEAVARDEERKRGKIRGKLHGIPILLKDNVATGSKMHTTAGALAMRSAFAKDEASLVKNLRKAGAVIIGKANMTEWANFISSCMPSGYSTLGGQVRNYYDIGFEVGGSSSGSAVGVSAGFALASIGTETSGSIVKPAINSGLVGVKPSKGLVSTDGIIPISPSQDIPGVIAKTVDDAALVLGVIAGKNFGNIRASEEEFDVRRFNIALLTDFFDELKEEFSDIIGLALRRIVEEGHHMSKVNDFFPYRMMNDVDAKDYLGEEVLYYEFAEALETYFTEWAVNCDISSLEDLIQFNEKNKKSAAKYGQDVFNDALEAWKNGGTSSPIYRNARIRDLKVCDENGLLRVFKEKKADVVVFPHYCGCTIPARAGYPSVTIPVGCGKTGFTGITAVGRKGEDFRLLNVARALERIVLTKKETFL